MRLDGRVALVTGGGSGIGRATAVRLAAEGMRVCVLDVDGVAAEAVAETVGGVGLACDVSSPDQVNAGFAECVHRLGGLDVAFLNAGITIGWSGDIAALDVADYRRSLGVNVDGVVFGAIAAVRAMRARPGSPDGAILATASLAGVIPWHPDPVYSLGKHAVVGFMRSIAANLAADSITVHTICPGITETGVLGDRRSLVERIGVPVMEPGAIADGVIAALQSPAESSGSCWIVRHGKVPWPMVFPHVEGPDNRLNVSLKGGRD